MAILTPTAGGVYFDPKDHMTDLVILVEPKRHVSGVPDKFNPGQTIDVIYADVSIFRDSGDIETAMPSEILLDAQIKSSILVKDILEKGWMDQQVAVTVQQPNRAYVWRPPTYTGAVQAVSDYVTERDAEREKAAEDFPFAE